MQIQLTRRSVVGPYTGCIYTREPNWISALIILLRITVSVETTIFRYPRLFLSSTEAYKR
jgi:hypothetical protein